jgi:hypothetical protein
MTILVKNDHFWSKMTLFGPPLLDPPKKGVQNAQTVLCREGKISKKSLTWAPTLTQNRQNRLNTRILSILGHFGPFLGGQLHEDYIQNGHFLVKNWVLGVKNDDFGGQKGSFLTPFLDPPQKGSKNDVFDQKMTFFIKN